MSSPSPAPFGPQTAKLTASDGTASDYFGSSVSISGNTVVVGANGATVGTNSDQGAAYVFTESGSSWTQTGKLTASDGAASDYFGNSISISGNTVVVGAVDVNNMTGAAYVFTESDSAWTQTAKLTAADGAAGDYFGSSVSISSNTVVVGANGTTVGGNSDQGAAYVFTESSSSWTQTAKLTAADGAAGDWFGYSVSISGDTVVVAAEGATVGTNSYQGAAYVFTESGSAWTQTAKLTASDGAARDDFGSSVSISGNTVVVGAQGATVGANSDQGAAYVFTESGSGRSDPDRQAHRVRWRGEQRFRLLGFDQRQHGRDRSGGRHGWYQHPPGGGLRVHGACSAWYPDRQAHRVRWRGERLFRHLGFDQRQHGGGRSGGRTVAPTAIGAAYVFTEPGSGWANMTQTAKLTASDGAASDYFGFSISISGNTVVVGVGHRSRHTAIRGRPTCSRSPAPLGPDRQAHRGRWRGGRHFRLLGFDQRQHGRGRSGGRHGRRQQRPGGSLCLHGARLRLGPRPPSSPPPMARRATGSAPRFRSAATRSWSERIAPRLATNFREGAAYVFTESSSAWIQTAMLTASDGAASDYSAPGFDQRQHGSGGRGRHGWSQH